MKFNSIVACAAVLAVCLTLASCQTSSKNVETSDASQADMADTATEQAEIAVETADQPAEPVETAAVSSQNAAPEAPGACAVTIAGGPPPKPAKGADFGKAVAKDTGKAAQRGLLQIVGGQLGGQLGAAAASGIAQSTIRAEGDIKGIWTITDGSQACACTLEVDGLFLQQGKGNDSGSVKPVSCSSPATAAMAHWALGYSFTGYGAKFELKAADKKTVLATLSRDGIHYFSGTLADGTPVTMWRDGQNYNSMKYGKK